jgi:hypothetical protein
MFFIWIPLHQFENPIEGMLLKKNPQNPTINQGNVPKKNLSSTITQGNAPNSH